jgi:ribulose-5-phosphate 4-epimerase/fuculose-1-phosphate aldolase
MCPEHKGPNLAGAQRASDKGEPSAPADPKLIEDVALANRILADHGVVDAFGHVSVRHDKRADRFLLARNMAPALVTPADILEFDLDGNPVNGQGRSVYLERFIHGEIFRARPDVHAIVHSHSPNVVPFGIVAEAKLRPIWHMSGFLGAAGVPVPVFEIRDVAGDSSDLLIRSNALGVSLARSLGKVDVVLMRGHGATIVGPDLRLAVYRAVYTEINARIQIEAMGLGTVNYLTPGEAAATAASNATQVNRAWDLWVRAQSGKAAP